MIVLVLFILITASCSNSMPPKFSIHNSDGKLIPSVISAYCWDGECKDTKLKIDDVKSGDYYKAAGQEVIEVRISEMDKYPVYSLNISNWNDDVEYLEEPQREEIIGGNKFILPMEAGKYIFSAHVTWEIGGDAIRWFLVEIVK